jgi:hypothetical protein
MPWRCKEELIFNLAPVTYTTVSANAFLKKMVQLITLIAFTFGQPPVTVDQKFIDKNFDLIDDFEKNKKVFRSDTFDLAGHSTEGGELIAFHGKDRDYLVFDIWLFGETGKIHATYWTDKDLNFKIVRRTDFKYDKPYYEKGYKVSETTEYLSYADNSVRRYSGDQKELNDSTDEKKMEAENFFKEITKDLKIGK